MNLLVKMADTKLKTTSSKSLDGNENQEQASSVRLPKQEEARILQKLTTNITESYQLVKQRQQKYNQVSTKLSESPNKLPAFLQWQEVCNNKNKLKRKKKLSASLTSVSDSVNQEKRTRIEGIQLNCRGRLSVQDVSLDSSTPAIVRRPEKLITKPPLPPTGKREESVTMNMTQVPGVQSLKLPPPRLKRKLQENMQTIQKLNALTEQLRLEINELKSNLITERGAVRVLRAQNESETRKWKNEIKKLQQTAELLKKHTTSARKPNDAIDGNTDTLHPSPAVFCTGSIVNNEIQRLTNEITAVKEAKKVLEEKKIINCDADRRKAADIRELRDSYEIRLTQLTKSAKTEISRLLEELKTKERSIGQLKKELQLQNSRNATNTNTTTYKTTNKSQQKQPEKKQNVNKIRKNSNESNINSQDTTKDINTVQNPNEMKQLKDLELINNTKNLQNNTNLNINTNNLNNNNNLKHTTIKTFNSSHNSKLKIQEPVLEIQQQEELQSQCTNNNTNNGNNMTCLLNNHSSNSTTKKQATPKCENLKDFHSLPRDMLTERFIESTHNYTHEEYRGGKVDNSDSDSALSSAPPSISPQPPSNGVEVTDIWQTLRNYSTNFEKLQKDLDLLHKENAELSEQLKLAKEQILESEKKMNVAANNTKLRELLTRISYLEDQEHQLQAESQELREQNELLEFRILELEDTNDKWSQQNPASPSCSPTHRSSTVTNSDVWACGEPNENDPMALLFRNVNRNQSNMDMHVDSEQMLQNSPLKLDDRLEAMSPCDLNLVNHTSNEELRSRLCSMLTQLPLNELEKQCLQQMLTLLQNLDAISQRSGPNSLTTSSCDEPSSLDLVKSRISDYSSASSSSTPSTFNARSTVSLVSSDSHSKSTKSSAPVAITTSTVLSNPRIVATVLPYNSSSASQHGPPNNTPTDSPRKSRAGWQCNSLSESGVFVESDFLSDAGENNVCTQTDFEEANQTALFTDAPNKEASTELQQKLQQFHCDYLHSTLKSQITPVYGDLQRLQYYKERLELLESKLLIYESSGDLQAKRLADRLQREIELAKQVKDLLDRVDFLEAENATLEEEKCEFEEAENDTRLRLQRLEVELEILSQRNIELEMSREALSAKYKDCRSECLILRDDLSVGETQIRHLEEDKQKAKENLEFLHSLLPLLMVYNTIVAEAQQHHSNTKQHLTEVTQASSSFVVMGNSCPLPESPNSRLTQIGHSDVAHSSSPVIENCQQREVHYLKEEVKCLRHQVKELNSRHYEAMESADSHWVDLEREYKDREEAFRAKETCLKQKINRLQDCLRDDARAANEKICQLEEAEKELKCCLLRLSKEHRDVSDEQQNLMCENERLKEQYEQLKEQQQPLRDSFEMEKKRNKSLSDELSFMRKLQSETECRNMQEMELLRTQLFELKKEFLHIEVTNSELKEEVCCLEQQVNTLQSKEKEYEDKICCLTDEVRNKEEMVSKLEKRLERSEGYSLAQELNGTPSKRFKREDVKDLHTASVGLGSALRNMKDCERAIPSAQKFQCVAREVKKLADTLLGENIDEEEEEVRNSKQEKSCCDIEQEKDLGNEDESVLVPENIKSEQDTELMGSEEVSIPVPQNPSTEQELVPAPQPEENPDQIAINPEEGDARNGSVTVGMAIMPDFVITDTMLPSFSLASKKAICEVPSELRKLKDTRTLQKNKTQVLEGLVKELDHLVKKPKKSKKNRKRNVKKRNVEIRHLTCKHTPVRRVFSCLTSRRPEVFHDASDIDIMQEEVLERYESFHSLRDEHSASHSESEEPNENNKQHCVKKDAATETNPAKLDKETETTNRVESGIQVNDDIYTNQLLDVLPPLSRKFLQTLHASTAETLNTRKFNEAFRMRWEVDAEFREGLNTLQNLANVQQNGDNKETASLENYENFVNAMSCLHILEEIYKPIKISLLQKIEDQINEQLMSFHSRQMESEFYCTVYYPVKRQVPLNITDFIMK